MIHSADVVIIGAGASGIRLAGLLYRAGLVVSVLEASERIGGRLLTVEPGVDLGATWFWENERDVFEVISEHGLEVFAQHSEGKMMYQIPDSVVAVDGNPLNSGAWRIVGGMQKLTDVLLQELPEGTLKTSTKVEKLEFSNQVDIFTNNGQWRSKYVVVALAPATAISNILFEPVLPKQLVDIASRTPVWMGGITKAVAIYEKPFWREMGLAGSAMSHAGPMREVHDISDQHASFGALFGFSPTSISESEVIAQLVSLFGPDAEKVTSVKIQDWSRLESISPSFVSQLTDYSLFGSPELRESYFDKKLYFSSTETSNQAPGHIQGALSAAKRTADMILSQFN